VAAEVIDIMRSMLAVFTGYVAGQRNILVQMHARRFEKNLQAHPKPLLKIPDISQRVTRCYE
jgi:hypothetical protein